MYIDERFGLLLRCINDDVSMSFHKILLKKDFNK